jgi:hypothetical protein
MIGFYVRTGRKVVSASFGKAEPGAAAVRSVWPPYRRIMELEDDDNAVLWLCSEGRAQYYS